MNGETLLAEERIFLDDAADFIDKNIHELGRELCKIGYFGEHRKDCEPPIVDRSYFANLTELEKSLDGDNRVIKSLSKRCKEDIRIGYYQSNIDYLRPRIDALKKKKEGFISDSLKLSKPTPPIMGEKDREMIKILDIKKLIIPDYDHPGKYKEAQKRFAKKICVELVTQGYNEYTGFTFFKFFITADVNDTSIKNYLREIPKDMPI
ncbi:hypothetical protein FACS189450_15180 [Spirochaetia bacterium]|nr:hypothetical protein FACS189450_15180 [Spirochaetia bacterium]